MQPEQQQEERRELLRIAAQTLLDHQAAGRVCDPVDIEQARQVEAETQPLVALDLGTTTCWALRTADRLRGDAAPTPEPTADQDRSPS